MSNYQSGQEWNDLLWGTPVTVVFGTNIVPARAWGKLSFAVMDAALVEENLLSTDADQLIGSVKSIVMSTFSSVLSARSDEVSDFMQLTGSLPQILETLLTELGQKMNGIGLQLKEISIEGLQKM